MQTSNHWKAPQSGVPQLKAARILEDPGLCLPSASGSNLSPQRPLPVGSADAGQGSSPSSVRPRAGAEGRKGRALWAAATTAANARGMWLRSPQERESGPQPGLRPGSSIRSRLRVGPSHLVGARTPTPRASNFTLPTTGARVAFAFPADLSSPSPPRDPRRPHAGLRLWRRCVRGCKRVRAELRTHDEAGSCQEA